MSINRRKTMVNNYRWSCVIIIYCLSINDSWQWSYWVHTCLRQTQLPAISVTTTSPFFTNAEISRYISVTIALPFLTNSEISRYISVTRALPFLTNAEIILRLWMPTMFLRKLPKPSRELTEIEKTLVSESCGVPLCAVPCFREFHTHKKNYHIE